ncbi:MAG: ABC transporter ATP-binding protein [Proteobacteria bacterium]|nr:ABC transporter ATP-binding protein [Pseudomonadota bacterium]
MANDTPSNARTAGHIEAENVVVQYGAVTAVKGVSLAIEAGRQLTLLGPSGCGKTTMLRAIAGLEQPASGEIRIGGKPVYSSARRINVPAERRELSMVFQSYAIWPHMSVFENVAYGLRVRKKAEGDIRATVGRALDLVQMGKFAERKASQLSGGQQQRVALARAFAFQPSVLLFDEPLSNLDAKLRGDMRIELRELQHRLGITSLYVTHDLEEALAMSDRIVVMRDGLIEQEGTPDEIYNRPLTAFVADFVGSSNLVRGRPRPDLARDGGVALETDDGIVVHGVAHGRPVKERIQMSLRTTHLRLSPERPAGDVNVWPVAVRRVVFQGDFTQAIVELGAQSLVVRATSLEGLSEGQPAFLSAAPRHCVLLSD